MWEDPFDEIKKMQKQMNKFFDKFESSFSKLPKLRQPLVDVIEKKDEVVITVELPGMDEKDIIVKAEEDKVDINAQKKKEHKVSKKGFFKHERSYSGFHRSFTLPAKVDTKKLKTEYKKGILKITLPKLKKKKKIVRHT